MLKKFNVRLVNGTWHPVGTRQSPLKLRLPSNTWQVFGEGSGGPLRLRMPDGTWRTVSTAGIGTGQGTVSGNVTYLDGSPAANKVMGISGQPLTYTTTDAAGNYLISDVPLGTYLVLAYSDENHYAYGTVVLNQADPSAVLDFILPAGYVTETLNYNASTARSGWVASVTTGTAYGNTTSGVAASSLLAASEEYFEYRNLGTGGNDAVSWLSVPINALRTFAEQHISLPPPFGLVRIDVVFNIAGNSYELLGLNVDPYPGAGAIVYQGPTPTDFVEAVTWRSPAGDRTDEVPVVRDKAFAREPGVNVWSGPLPHSDGNIVAKYSLDPDYPEEAAQFHAYTSEAPVPATSGGGIVNSMSVDVSVDFIYRFG